MKSLVPILVALAISVSAVRADEEITNETSCASLPVLRSAHVDDSKTLELIDAVSAACRVNVEMSVEEAERLLSGKLSAMSVAADKVTFVARANANEVYVSGALMLGMKRVGSSDLWVAAARLTNLPEATITYWPLEMPWRQRQASETQYESIVWRGERAPLPPPTKAKLSGRILKQTLFSQALQETRRIVTYLPPGYSTARRYPALYVADGANVEWYATLVEELTDRGLMAPIVMIGAVSGQSGVVEDRSSLKVELRAADYLPGWEGAGDRFDRHMRFFCLELVPWAEEKFALSARREMRAVQGVSNGAVFASAAGFKHPEVFGTALAFSPGSRIDGVAPVGPRAHFVLTGGRYEAYFFLAAMRTARNLKRQGFVVAEEYPYSGHDSGIWSILLGKYLPGVFPTIRKR